MKKNNFKLFFKLFFEEKNVFLKKKMFSRYIPLDIIKYVLLDYLDEYFIFIEDNLFILNHL